MVEFNGTTDPKFDENKKFSALDNFFLKFINDKRDLAFVYLSIQITLFALPLVVLLFSNVLQGGIWWAVCSAYLLIMLLYFMPSFTLMLHNTSHNALYKKEYGFMNYYIPWFVGLFFGQSPKTYIGHHVGMHHAENNLPIDDSSTMKYQRDSFIDFLKYYFTFMGVGIVHLAQYFTMRKQPKKRTMVLKGEIFYFTLIFALCFISVKASLMLFLVPLIIIRFAMMAGNWGQHAFLDHRTPGSSYRNSITCINTVYNHKCFNDGYHIGHHLYPNLHWTEMATNFEEEIDIYIEQRCIVFQKLDFFMVWFWLMQKRYDVLANNYVNLGNQFQTDEDLIAFLKERTKKFESAEIEFVLTDALAQKRR
ncbi:MAG: fatty acid desaturase family protein [Chitinophagales bacterium]